MEGRGGGGKRGWGSQNGIGYLGDRDVTTACVVHHLLWFWFKNSLCFEEMSNRKGEGSYDLQTGSVWAPHLDSKLYEKANLPCRLSGYGVIT